jgi:hypothetical protein
VAAIGTEQRAIHGDMGVSGGAGGQQRPAQPGYGRGEDVDAFVQVAVGRRAADPLSAASWASRVPSRNQRSTSTACR